MIQREVRPVCLFARGVDNIPLFLGPQSLFKAWNLLQDLKAPLGVLHGEVLVGTCTDLYNAQSTCIQIQVSTGPSTCVFSIMSLVPQVHAYPDSSSFEHKTCIRCALCTLACKQRLVSVSCRHVRIYIQDTVIASLATLSSSAGVEIQT